MGNLLSRCCKTDTEEKNNVNNSSNVGTGISNEFKEKLLQNAEQTHPVREDLNNTFEEKNKKLINMDQKLEDIRQKKIQLNTTLEQNNNELINVRKTLEDLEFELSNIKKEQEYYEKEVLPFIKGKLSDSIGRKNKCYNNNYDPYDLENEYYDGTENEYYDGTENEYYNDIKIEGFNTEEKDKKLKEKANLEKQEKELKKQMKEQINEIIQLENKEKILENESIDLIIKEANEAGINLDSEQLKKIKKEGLDASQRKIILNNIAIKQKVRIDEKIEKWKDNIEKYKKKEKTFKEKMRKHKKNKKELNDERIELAREHINNKKELEDKKIEPEEYTKKLEAEEKKLEKYTQKLKELNNEEKKLNDDKKRLDKEYKRLYGNNAFRDTLIENNIDNKNKIRDNSAATLLKEEKDELIRKRVERLQKKFNDFNEKELNGFVSVSRYYGEIENLIEINDDKYIDNRRKTKANIPGFYHEGRIYIKDGYPELYCRIMHEYLHSLSDNHVYEDGKLMQSRCGVSIDGKDRCVNEAITQLYTKRIMKEEYYKNFISAYSKPMQIIEMMEPYFDKDILKQAYFKNQPELLVDKFNEFMGYGEWDRFSKLMDVVIDDEKSEQEKQYAFEQANEKATEFAWRVKNNKRKLKLNNEQALISKMNLG